MEVGAVVGPSTQAEAQRGTFTYPLKSLVGTCRSKELEAETSSPGRATPARHEQWGSFIKKPEPKAGGASDLCRAVI